MGLFWSLKIRGDVEVIRSALKKCPEGDIAVVLGGEELDTNLAYMGCQLAKGAKRKIHFIYAIEVPRALPLRAVLAGESEPAQQLLDEAMAIAHRVGCKAVAEIVQARDAGSAIVDEVEDHRCALLLMGFVRRHRYATDFGKIVSFVLENAPCRVWFVQDPPELVAQRVGQRAAS